jgi:hypothetical protein
MTIRYLTPVFLLIALGGGCSHGEPFTHRSFGSDSTRTRGADRQLTYNFTTDRTPAWTPGGDAILYMAEDGRRQDRCLAELPPTGGTIRAVFCPATLGSLAGLMVASLENPLEATLVQPYPYTAANGKIHQSISHIRWLSAAKAVYLAERVNYIFPPGNGPVDTIRTGLELVQVDLSGPAIQIIPNTDETSSVSAGSNPDEVYLTKNGDARVFKLTLSTGTQVVVHDFGTGEIARDVEVVGNRLYAIVGGEISFVVDPVLGSLQRDGGGQIRMVDLTNGSVDSLVVPDRLFRRPTPSPTGGAMIAEGYQVTIISLPGFQDIIISTVADLWYFEVP